MNNYGIEDKGYFRVSETQCGDIAPTICWGCRHAHLWAGEYRCLLGEHPKIKNKKGKEVWVCSKVEVMSNE